MELTKFLKLQEYTKDTNVLLKVEKIIQYFIFSYACYEMYKEYLARWVKGENHADYKFQASILGIYANGKICLDLTKSLNTTIEDDVLAKLRKDSKEWAIRFSGFRNDTASHPINNDANCFSHISSYGNLGSSMNVYLINTDDMSSSKKYEINPQEDINKLFNYLESLADIYSGHFIKDEQMCI